MNFERIPAPFKLSFVDCGECEIVLGISIPATVVHGVKAKKKG